MPACSIIDKYMESGELFSEMLIYKMSPLSRPGAIKERTSTFNTT
jgi:hypothetical protein